MGKQEIPAVHRMKLKEFVQELGLLDALAKGELKCCMCGRTLSIENLELIIPSNQQILLCCSDPSCVFRIRALEVGGSKL